MAAAGTGIAAHPPRRPTGGDPAGTLSPAVAYGLLAAWAAHDLEEVLAFGPFAQHAVPRLRGAVSRRSRSCLAGRRIGGANVNSRWRPGSWAWLWPRPGRRAAGAPGSSS